MSSWRTKYGFHPRSPITTAKVPTVYAFRRRRPNFSEQTAVEQNTARGSNCIAPTDVCTNWNASRYSATASARRAGSSTHTRPSQVTPSSPGASTRAGFTNAQAASGSASATRNIAFFSMSAHQPLLREPVLDQRRDLQVVLVHHQHVRVAAHAGLGQIENVDLASRLGDLVEETVVVLPDLRPARVERDVVAEDGERGDALQRRGLLRIAYPRGLDRDQRLHLVRPRLRHLEAELPGLRVKEDDTRTHAIDERDICADDRLVGRRPARHALLHEIVVGLDRELHVRHQLALRRVGTPGTDALPDGEPLPGIRFGEKHRLALENVRRHRPARAAALHRVRVVHIPALLHEEIHPALAPVGRRLVRPPREPPAVPHQERHRAAAIRRQKILNVHRFNGVRAVQVYLRRHPARREHHLLHGLPGNLHIAPADMERTHVAESVGGGGAGGEGCYRPKNKGLIQGVYPQNSIERDPRQFRAPWTAIARA